MMKNYKLFIDYGPFNEKIIDAMYDVRFCGMPASFLLLDNRKTNTYCHLCASLLTFVIPNSKRVEGKLVTLDGGEHSWVEFGDMVYDTSDLLMWDKQSYYERFGVLSSDVVSDEEVHSLTDKYLNSKGFLESFVCWIEDLEGNLHDNIYQKFLIEHIERFKKEIGYDSLEIDEEQLEKSREDLKSVYSKIAGFIKNNPVNYKRNGGNKMAKVENIKAQYMVYDAESVPSCVYEVARALELFVGDMDETIRSSRKASRDNCRYIQISKLTNFFYDLFGYEVEDSEVYSTDTDLIIRQRFLADRYREHFLEMLDALSMDNFYDIYKLSMFTYDSYADNYRYLESLRDGVAFAGQGIGYYAPGEDTQVAFSEFFDEEIQGLKGKEKVYKNRRLLWKKQN